MLSSTTKAVKFFVALTLTAFVTVPAQAVPRSYLIALNDAGISVTVGKAVSVGSGARYSVTVREPDRDVVYLSFNRSPSPEQVTKLIAVAQPSSSTTRGSKAVQITLPNR